MAKMRMTQPDRRALGTLLEQPESFEFEGREGTKKSCRLYPLQLGRLAMISQRLLDLDLMLDDAGAAGNTGAAGAAGAAEAAETAEAPEVDAVRRMWAICAERPRQVAEIIAIATLRTRQEIETELEARTDELLWSPTMTPQALRSLLYAIVFQSYHADFLSAIRSVKTLRVTISQQTAAERIAPTAEAPFGER